MRTTLLAVLLTAIGGGASPDGDVLVTAPVRLEHEGIAEELRHVESWVDAIDRARPADRALYARRVVFFLDEHIAPHLAWEERRLFPAIDGRNIYVFAITDPARYEHRIIERWIERLGDEAGSPRPDYERFARHAHNLLGLIAAHFEMEEQALFPILDAAMTPEEYEREVGHGTHGGPT